MYFYCSAVTDPDCATDQINVLTPLDATVGQVQVVVTNSEVSTPAFTVNMKAVAPTFLLFSTQGYVAATHADYSLLGATTLYPGFSTPAKRGEAILLYAVGFGLPRTPLTAGSSTQSGSLPAFPACTLGGASATVTFAGIVSYPELHTIVLTVPKAASPGDNLLRCTYNGATIPVGNWITVQ